MIFTCLLVFEKAVIKITAVYIDFEGAEHKYILQILIGALKVTGDSWLGFGIMIMIWEYFLKFNLPLIKIFAFLFDFESAKSTLLI